LNSSVFTWPDRSTVDRAFRDWAVRSKTQRPELLRAGYIGSYARGDWGVGSDLDVILVVERSDRPFLERGLDWNVSELPVPADLLIYTSAEWSDLERASSRFSRAARGEAVWVLGGAPAARRAV
jgi:hypothetical protein